MVASHNAYDFVAVVCCGSYNGPDASIHSRGIAATTKYANSHCLFPKKQIGTPISYLNLGRIDRSRLERPEK
jgi:hypothetical protein